MAATATASPAQVTSLLDKLPTGPIHVLAQRWWFALISAILLIPGLVFMGLMVAKSPNHMPLKLGIDFTGGTFVDVGFTQPLGTQATTDIHEALEKAGFEGAAVQLHEPPAPSKSTSDVKLAETPLKAAASIRLQPLDTTGQKTLMDTLKTHFGPVTLLQKNAVGPTLAQELLVNGVMALLFAYVLIVGYLTFRFQFDFAVCAILALIHDTLFVFGAFAALGYLYGVEIDGLFITALLTVIGFSVHDSIIVFDRIRENVKLFYSKKLPFSRIIDISVNQTLARSINTTLTALLPMITLYLFGGETTKNFMLAIIIGLVVGAYSSICVASLLLALWRARTSGDAEPSPVNAGKAVAA